MLLARWMAMVLQGGVYSVERCFAWCACDSSSVVVMLLAFVCYWLKWFISLCLMFVGCLVFVLRARWLVSKPPCECVSVCVVLMMFVGADTGSLDVLCWCLDPW